MRAASSARGVDPATAAVAPAKVAPCSGTVMSGCSEKASWRGQGLERRGARAVADQAAGGEAGGGGGDLAVGHAQQHDVGAGAVGPAAERALDRDARLAQAVGQRAPEAPASDDRY